MKEFDYNAPLKCPHCNGRGYCKDCNSTGLYTEPKANWLAKLFELANAPLMLFGNLYADSANFANPPPSQAQRLAQQEADSALYKAVWGRK